MQTVLIIDDNEAVRTALDVLLSIHDIRSLPASSPEEGLRLLEREAIDVVIQDMNFSADTTSGAEGIELFNTIRRYDPDLPVILLTAWTHLEQAVELVKGGATDYLQKPWDDDKLLTTVRNLLQLRRVTEENRRLNLARHQARNALGEEFDLCGIIYESEAMHNMVSMATHIAHADVPVLITGPNGSGKEKLAEIVQANSSCANGPFVRVNIGALPSELLESELFGVESGAYTGANKSRQGRFEAADGGTLFLDEIGNLPLGGQVKLLRVLQTGEFERLGSTQTRKVTVRLISATNTDLQMAAGSGEFREDLFYRLNVIELKVPSLADRREDILPLAEHFLNSDFQLSPAARRSLTTHDWPGNVRELRNCIQRAVLLADSNVIDVETLGIAADSRLSAIESRAEPDRKQIIAALDQARGVVARAARSLGLSRQALYRRMEKFDIAND